jgi:ribosome maturation factor RimP
MGVVLGEWAMAGVATAMAQTIGRTVEGLGYEFVDAERLAAGLLRVTIDRAEGIGLADCEKVSRQLTHLLAVENVEYARLEVSSPGLDRPLKRAADFERFTGAEVEVRLYAPLAAAGGRKRLAGRLLGMDGAPGAERIRMQLAPDDGPGAAGAKRAGGAAKAVRGGSRRAAKKTETASVSVEFALAEVEKAKLVPELDFRGGSKE